MPLYMLICVYSSCRCVSTSIRYIQCTCVLCCRPWHWWVPRPLDCLMEYLNVILTSGRELDVSHCLLSLIQNLKWYTVPQLTCSASFFHLLTWYKLYNNCLGFISHLAFNYIASRLTSHHAELLCWLSVRECHFTSDVMSPGKELLCNGGENARRGDCQAQHWHPWVSGQIC